MCFYTLTASVDYSAYRNCIDLNLALPNVELFSPKRVYCAHALKLYCNRTLHKRNKQVLFNAV
jgi:hypothetical protein